MDSRTGELYDTKGDALKALVPEEDIVEIIGTEEAVKRVSERITSDEKRVRRAKARRAKQSRKLNRRKK